MVAARVTAIWTVLSRHNKEEDIALTIILKPEQEQLLRGAINSGLAHTTDEALDKALELLRVRLAERRPLTTVFEQGLGLFGSPEDSALLDEIVSIAYEERHRRSDTGPVL